MTRQSRRTSPFRAYADKLTKIRKPNAHNEVQMSGTRAKWKEILAVYAVKINREQYGTLII